MPSTGWSLDPASGYSDADALAEFNRVILANAQRRNQRNYVYPAARNYEINYIREQIQRSADARAARAAQAATSSASDSASERASEYNGESESEGEGEGESESEEDESNVSFVTAPQSFLSEESCSIAERVDEPLINDLADLSITAFRPPSIVVTDYGSGNSTNSTIILTPSSHGSMDADYLAQRGEGAAPPHEDDELSNFIAPSDDEDDDEDMGNSDVEVGYGDSEGEAEDEDDLDLDGPPVVPFNPVAMGLKEIGGLARFRVSSYKPGNGVEELINDDTERYWQSDGIQPHRLTMTFVKRVEIRALRFYVDYTQDESYTPTRISWFAGTSEHDLHAFGTSTLVNPAGWIDVPLTGAGGGEDGNSLFAWVVQMRIIENHQNGKDTHIRGVKVYGFDDQLRAAGATGRSGGGDDGGGGGDRDFRVDETKDAEENEKALKDHLRAVEFTRSFQDGDPSGTASSLDFMEDPILR